jgi:hypothetical protein
LTLSILNVSSKSWLSEAMPAIVRERRRRRSGMAGVTEERVWRAQLAVALGQAS